MALEFVDYNGNDIEEDLLATLDSPGLMSPDQVDLLSGIHQKSIANGISKEIRLISKRSIGWLYDKALYSIFGHLNGNMYFGFLSIYDNGDGFSATLYDIFTQNITMSIQSYNKNEDGDIVITFSLPEHSVVCISGTDPFKLER